MGRRRRRRKILRRPKPKIPSIFECPACGVQAVVIEMKPKEGIAIVKCGNCGLGDTISINPSTEPVDVYAEFVDKYHSGALEESEQIEEVLEEAPE
ncbi:MAG: transcription elongation factor [Candidatus Baldrarchaeia archaeon]